MSEQEDTTDKYRYEYSPEEKAAIREEIAIMNKRAASLFKGDLHPRVKLLREHQRVKNNGDTDVN